MGSEAKQSILESKNPIFEIDQILRNIEKELVKHGYREEPGKTIWDYTKQARKWTELLLLKQKTSELEATLAEMSQVQHKQVTTGTRPSEHMR